MQRWRPHDLDVVVEHSAQVGEGPVFDPRTGALCWVDIPNGLLHQSDLITRATVTSDIGMQLGAIAPRAAGADTPGFAAAAFDGFGVWAEGELTILDPVLADPIFRMNDAKCDSRGRLWAGSTHVQYLPGYGRLHRWDGVSDGTVMADGFILPNGIGWSPDDRIMYFVDSFADTLMTAPFDAVDGTIGEFTVLRSFERGHPDGLAVDVDGCIWVAVWGASEVHRYTPAGDLAGVIRTPVTQPSSCAFGPDGTLYITSARDTLTPEALEAEPLAGSVFALTPGVDGVPVAPFGA